MWFQFVNWVEIDYLPIYYPSQQEKEDPVLYSNNVRNYMASHMTVRVTDHSYDDVRLLILAQKLSKESGVAMTGDFIFSDLSKLYKMDIRQAQDLLKKFAGSDAGKTNRLTYPHFCQLLELPDTPELVTIFEQFDTHGNGYIDFKELLTGTVLLSKNTGIEETLRKTFNLFDLDQDGTIDKEEFKSVMRGLYPKMTVKEVETHWALMQRESPDAVTYHEFCEYGKKHPVHLKTAHDRLIHVPTEHISIDLDD